MCLIINLKGHILMTLNNRSLFTLIFEVAVLRLTILTSRFACLSYSKRHLHQKDDEDVEVEDDDEEERDEDVDTALAHFVKKGKGNSCKRPGRKPRWCSKSLDDFIDIVVNSNEFKTKLIFTNTKNQRNGPIYVKIVEELKERASARGDKFTMTVNQIRTKFKKCISQCKQAALTQKTATGIKRYQEDRGFGKWFNALFDVVKTRDSCQPEHALEPSTSRSAAGLQKQLNILHSYSKKYTCVAGKAGFCNHISALMFKICKYTLFEAKTTKDLCQEKDEIPELACTSQLQRWHKKGGGENIFPQPVMEVYVTKTKFDEPSSSRRSGGVKCLLYKARKQPHYNPKNEASFKKELATIDPNMGFAHLSQGNNISGETAQTKNGVIHGV